MKQSRNEQLAAFFRARPNQWIDGRRLEFAGSYAWRTRVSNLRKAPFGMVIENRLRATLPGALVSEYRYVPPAPASLRVLHVEASGSAETIKAALAAIQQGLF